MNNNYNLQSKILDKHNNCGNIGQDESDLINNKFSLCTMCMYIQERQQQNKLVPTKGVTILAPSMPNQYEYCHNP